MVGARGRPLPCSIRRPSAQWRAAVDPRQRQSRPDRVIDTAGTLLSGESFQTVRDLKHILVTDRRRDFYRCLTEKLLTYALGRGLDYYDVYTVDQIVERIDQQNARPSVLISGIIESAPFQKRRAENTP